MVERRVVMVAMPCREVVIGGALDIFHAANQYLQETEATRWTSSRQWPPSAHGERSVWRLIVRTARFQATSTR